VYSEALGNVADVVPTSAGGGNGTVTTPTPGTFGDAKHLTYKITNPGGASITVGLDGTNPINADNNTVQLGSETELANAATPALDETGAGAAPSALTNPFIYVVGSDGNVTTPEVTRLTISTTSPVGVTLTVQAFLDVDSDGFQDVFGEPTSAIVTVNLLPASAVSATTVMSEVSVGSDDFKATVTYGQDVNPYQVESRTGVRILRNGVVVEPGIEQNNVTDLSRVSVDPSPAAGTPGVAKNTLVAGVVASTGDFEGGTSEVQLVTGTSSLTGALELTLGGAGGVDDVLTFAGMTTGMTDAVIQAGLRADTDYDASAYTVTVEVNAGTNLINIRIVYSEALGNVDPVTPTSAGGANGTVTTPTTGVAEFDLGEDVTAGIYSAVAFYDVSAAGNLDLAEGLVQMGAPSSVIDLTVGASTKVDEINPVVPNTANQKYQRTVAADAEEVYVRSGTKTVTFGAQILDGNVVLKDANVEVRAIVSGVALDATTSITVSGANGTLVKNGAPITALARTDSNGRVSFTLTSSTGKKNDAVNVDIQYKNSTGLFVSVPDHAAGGVENGLDIKFFDATLSGFAPKPAAYASGANPTVTFAVTDQWSQPVSFIDDDRLSVYASAFVGGVEDASIFAERVTVVDGKAAFTFANFAKAGATAELRATLYQGATGNPQSTSVILYNTSATEEITVANSFTTDITYTDYVTGDASVPAVADALEDTGLDADTARATIAGNVQNASGAGQPGVAVTVASDGALFYDAAQGIYAEDSILIYANEFGAFTVFAYSHTVSALGAPVTITADGATASTKLVTYFPADQLDRDVLDFSWNFPAQLTMNTTYAVTATLTDKWGNPVQTSGATGSVSFVGNGSVQVNGVNDATVKDFDKNGKTIIFVRSIKDIAGPGAVSATLLPLAAGQYSTNPTFVGPDAVAGNADDGTDGLGTLAATTVDDDATAWDETLFDRELSVEVDVTETAPAATGKVNVGSFNGKLVVYALGLDGARITWKVGGNWGQQFATGDSLNRFDRPTPLTGVTVSVDIWVDGVKQLTKSVVTR
jgi:hypothetical protein